MHVEVPDGDVADRISILAIKAQRLRDPAKRAHVQAELGTLHAAWAKQIGTALDAMPDYAALCEVNGALWDVEDALRELERQSDFGPGFVELARRVYTLNDRRARLKAAISEATGSRLREQKSYT